VDGPLTVTACSEQDHSCDQYSKCNIRDPLWRIKDRIIAALSATSVAELATDVASPLTSGFVPVTVSVPVPVTVVRAPGPVSPFGRTE
jgi:hypothetical protein